MSRLMSEIRRCVRQVECNNDSEYPAVCIIRVFERAEAWMAYFIYPDHGCGRTLRNVSTSLPNNTAPRPKLSISF